MPVQDPEVQKKIEDVAPGSCPVSSFRKEDFVFVVLLFDQFRRRGKAGCREGGSWTTLKSYVCPRKRKGKEKGKGEGRKAETPPRRCSTRKTGPARKGGEKRVADRS